MKYLPRAVAFGKLKAMAEGAKMSLDEAVSFALAESR